MSRQNARSWNVVVVGAGIIGACVAYALAREGREVLLVDRAPPGIGGASFGNAGHLAAELLQPLPSRELLWGFWRKLSVLGGPLDLPLQRVPALLPWFRRFAAASNRQAENTLHLAPLVRHAVSEMQRWCSEIGRPDLVRPNGHYEVWFGRQAVHRARRQALAMEQLEIPTRPAEPEWLRTLHADGGQALHFTSTGHVSDPLDLVLACVEAARERGCQLLQAEVRALEPSGSIIRVQTSSGEISCSTVVVCTGAWSTSLLQPLGLTVPMEAVRGYHIELQGERPRADAPILYSDEHLVITPLRGRLRASSFMDFVRLDSPHDARKRTRLLSLLQRLGYECSNAGPAWAGPRPVLPDYLPGIGRVEGTNVYYAVGHQHVGLTLAPVTAQLMAALVAGRAPKHDLRAFDLRRFGRPARGSFGRTD